MKKTIFLLILVLAIGGLFGAFVLTNRGQSSKVEDSNILSRSGVHWHPEMTIYIKGEKQDIPANLGIGLQYKEHPMFMESMGMTDVHTHTDLPKLHWEITRGPVTRQDARLGIIFEIWGKPFSSTTLFDKVNGPEGAVKMTVNGQPNTEFDNYIVKDGDIIEIRFE